MWVYRPVRSHSGRNHAMLPAPTAVKVNKNFRSQRYLGAWYTLWQVLWRFGEISLFIYKQISFFLIKCANHWDKRTFCSTSCWLASNINRWRQPYRQNYFFVFIPVKFLLLFRLFRILNLSLFDKIRSSFCFCHYFLLLIIERTDIAFIMNDRKEMTC